MNWRYEGDDWGPGPSILAATALATLRSALDETSLMVEHRFYRGSRAPDRLIFDDYYELEAYLRGRTRPGDSFLVWRFDLLCRDDNRLLEGKVPDADGSVPAGGAY